MTEGKKSETAAKYNIGQDWASVVAGFILIIFVIATGYSVAIPSLGGKEGWSGLGSIAAMLDGKFGMSTIYTFLVFGLVSALGMFLSGDSLKKFLTGFLADFLLALIAQFIASYSLFKTLGLETVFFSLILGLLIGNFFRLPSWVRPGVQTELYVKIGLILLGATILFRDILTAGTFGLIQAVIVVISVWYFAFWISRKLKVDDEFSTMLASAVSICGVSAAIATAGAINGDKKKLSFTISLVLIVAIPMMIFLPIIA